MLRFCCMLLLVSLCHVVASQEMELFNDFSECANQDTCSTQSAAVSLLQLRAHETWSLFHAEKTDEKTEETTDSNSIVALETENTLNVSANSTLNATADSSLNATVNDALNTTLLDDVNISVGYNFLKFSLAKEKMHWVWGTYHKTGCELARALLERMGGVMPHYHNFEKPVDFSNLPFRNWYYQPDMQVLHSLSNYRFVHFVRDPADLIVSAYRFHMLAAEEFLQKPMKTKWAWRDQFYGYLPELKSSVEEGEYIFRHNVPEEHQPLLRRLFYLVNQGKSLPEYYNSSSETDGVLVEAYRSWWQIDMMVDNYKATRMDEHALQVRMESVKSNFQDNMKCVLEFLSDARAFDTDFAMKRIDLLDTSKYGTAAAAEGDATHIAKNIDNEELFEVLKAVPFVEESRQKLSLAAVHEC